MPSLYQQQQDVPPASSNKDQALPTLGRDTPALHPSCSSSPTSMPSSSTGTPHQMLRPAAETTLEDHDSPLNGKPCTLTFRVTGAASVARLEPLLLDHDHRRGNGRLVTWTRARKSGGDAGGNNNDLGARLDFVWETTVSKLRHKQHRNARVLNRLSGAQVCLVLHRALLNRESLLIGQCTHVSCPSSFSNVCILCTPLYIKVIAFESYCCCFPYPKQDCTIPFTLSWKLPVCYGVFPSYLSTEKIVPTSKISSSYCIPSHRYTSWSGRVRC